MTGCNPPPTFYGRHACEAAAESPAALGRYIKRVQAMTNLQFADYVNHATVARWQASNLVPGTDSAADSMERGTRVPELVQEEPATTGNQPR